MTSHQEAIALEEFKAQLARETETHKAKLAVQGEEHKLAAATHQALMGAAFSYAGIAMRGLLLANGGGVIAIMTFVGNLWSRGDPAAARIAASMTTSTRLFVGGVVAAFATSFGAYLRDRHKVTALLFKKLSSNFNELLIARGAIIL